MSQFGWIFLDDYGNKFNVGLYHGVKTGHVIIHCDNRILYVDFHVLKSKTYSFYLSDELCEIELKEDEGYFEYQFNINKKADTLKNKERKKRGKRERIYSILLFVAFILCIFIITWLITTL